jgi:hypothetical protein
VKTAVAAATPDPKQDVADLLAAYLALRLAREQLAEHARVVQIKLDRGRREWWERERRRSR